MNSEKSFQFVFYDLLDLIDSLSIKYQHKIFPEIIYDEFIGWEPTGRSKWGLNIVQFFNSNGIGNFNRVIDKRLEKIHIHISKDRIALNPFLKYFIEEIDNRIQFFSDFKKNKIHLDNLVASKKIHLSYIGYLSLEKDHENQQYHSWGAFKEPTEKPDFDEFAYDEIQKLLRSYLQCAINKLNRLVLFLKHELNLVNTQQSAFEKSANNSKLIELIAAGEVKQVFKKLLNKKHKSSQLIIELSYRHNSLEKDKIQNIISYEEYYMQRSKIVASLITILSD